MKSIIQTVDKCYICGAVSGLEEHHIFGGFNRKLSEKYGLKVKLCNRHHTGSYTNTSEAVHCNADMMQALREEGQTKAMEHYGWSIEEFRRIFGKNYI